jgi:hypothetical protein
MSQPSPAEEAFAGRYVPLMPMGRAENPLFRAGVGFSDTTLGLEDISSIPGGDIPLVFPSHFWSHPERSRILEHLRQREQPCFFQVSSGFELTELLYPLSEAYSPGFGLEVVFDQALHTGDWSRIRILEKIGFRIRYLLCAQVGISIIDLIKALPADTRGRFAFYFAAPRTKMDLALNSDEIRIWLASLREEFGGVPLQAAEYLRPFERFGSHLLESPESAQYRFELKSEFYRKNFDRLGTAPIWRRLARLLVNSWIARIVFRIVWLLRFGAMELRYLPRRIESWLIRFYVNILRHLLRQVANRLYWTLRSCTSGLGMIWRISTTRSYWWLRSNMVTLYWRIWKKLNPFYWRVRSGLSQVSRSAYWTTRSIWLASRGLATRKGTELYWSLRRGGTALYWHCWTAANRLYWGTRHVHLALRLRIYCMICHPIFTLKKSLPPIYWILVFPLQKLYWFTQYQLQQRLLKERHVRNS